MGLGVAYCDLAPSEFYGLTPHEFGNILKPCLERHTQKSRRTWEAARFQAWLAIQPHIDHKKSKIKGPDDIIKFAWERPEKQKKFDMSPEAIKEYIDILDPKHYGRRKRSK